VHERLRAERTISALRREAALYRRVLDEVLLVAANALLADGHDPVAYRVSELVGAALRHKRPAGASE
jgi:hypothetical protein